MKIQLFVEGDVEQKVLPGFLRRWLLHRGIKELPEFPTPHNFHGCGSLLKEIGKSAAGFLGRSDADEPVAAIGIADLKDPIDHSFFPANVTTVGDRYDYGVSRIQEQVGDPRFRMYFSVHELEAWLLAQPALLPPEIQPALDEIAADPEEVNFDEPPGRLLERLFREAVNRRELRHPYRKMKHGVRFFRQLDPEIAYGKCPYLSRMLDDVLALAGQSHGHEERG